MGMDKEAKLYEYAEYIGDELGETLELLAGLYRSVEYLDSPEFTKQIEAQIDKTLDYLDNNTKIVIKDESVTRTIHCVTVEWKGIDYWED